MIPHPSMRPTLTPLTALLLAPLAELQASYFKTPRIVTAPFSTSAQPQTKLNP
jgi:hypothetical protein